MVNSLCINLIKDSRSTLLKWNLLNPRLMKFSELDVFKIPCYQ